MAADRVLLSRDDRTISLVEISRATPTPSAAVGFRIVVEQCYRAGMEETGEDDDEADTMEDVACRVPVGELTTEGGGAAAAAVDRAFEELVSRLDHPTLIREVAPEVRKAAAHVRAMGEIGALAGAELRLRVVFLDDSLEEEESEPEPDDEEEVGSDLELDEECWEHGGYDVDGGDGQYEHDQAAPGDDDAGGAQFSTPRPQRSGGAWRYEHGEAALGDDDEEEDGGGAAQFTARPFDGALAREGGPSDGTLLLSGFEARADGPELGEQHELTPRDVRRLVRLAFRGGDVERDEAYWRALDSGVSPGTRAAMLDRALRSATRRPTAPAPSGMPPARMRTGF